jgi:peptidoglycan/xylan/chitin deacetylase (PgdA/CDA1 family)
MNSRLFKSLLGRFVYKTGAHDPMWRDRAVITAFHTISDARPTPISCSRDEFAQYCDFFARHFRVVSLTELLNRLAEGRDISRHLVITFDDGYKDNIEVAAEELERLALPACFFVTTDFIGSDHVPWWDAEHGIASRWMTWDDVRELHARGFEIGAHTVTHPDLGQTTPEVAELEVATSMARIERELGVPPTHFAYPYGRLENLREESRLRLRRLGLRSCLSCCGGTVEPDSDPFRLERVGISPWFLSVYHFGFETASVAWLRRRKAARVRRRFTQATPGRKDQLIEPEGLLEW